MKVLKLKIFDVLTKKITVSEFETWLYNSEEFLSRIKTDTFAFDVICVDYKNESWKEKLFKVVNSFFDEETMKILTIEIDCSNILASNNAEEIYNIVKKYWEIIDYDTEYDICWKFYDLEYKFNSFDYTIFDKLNLKKESKYYANQVVSKLNGIENLKDKNTLLSEDLLGYEIEKNFLKKKSKPNPKTKNICFFQKNIILRIIGLIFERIKK